MLCSVSSFCKSPAVYQFFIWSTLILERLSRKTQQCRKFHLITRTLHPADAWQEGKNPIFRSQRKHPNKKNTYILQMSEKINKIKQTVAITAIRNHFVQGFCSLFPNGKKKKSELESSAEKRDDYTRAKGGLGQSSRCWVMLGK